MSWISLIYPLVIAGLIFIAYLGGKSAGRKEAEIKRNKEEQGASDNVDKIISNNNYMSADDIDAWLRSRTKK